MKVELRQAKNRDIWKYDGRLGAQYEKESKNGNSAFDLRGLLKNLKNTDDTEEAELQTVRAEGQFLSKEHNAF